MSRSRLPAWCAAAALAAVGACGEQERQPEPPAQRTTFFVQTDSIASLRAVGNDTLSDSAYVLRLVPEPDGRTIAVVFADPDRPIVAGLALEDDDRHAARLVWPDSVTSAWWAGEHRLVFQSTMGAGGIHAVVDVHADSLEHLEAAHDTVPRDVARIEWPAGARERATRYIDSLRAQPEGVPQSGTLQYSVTTARRAPNDSLLAFYVSARGPGTDAQNPIWYLLDLHTLQVTPVDSVTGPARIMGSEAAGWAPGGRFVYAKGVALYDARIAEAARSLR